MTPLVRPDASHRSWARAGGALRCRRRRPLAPDALSPVTPRRLDRSIHHRLAGRFRLVRKNVPDTPGRQTRLRPSGVWKARSARHSVAVAAASQRLDQRVQRRLIEVRLLAAVRWRRRALVGDGRRYSMANTLQRLSPPMLTSTASHTIMSVSATQRIIPVVSIPARCDHRCRLAAVTRDSGGWPDTAPCRPFSDSTSPRPGRSRAPRVPP